jgi:hypothetical protein
LTEGTLVDICYEKEGREKEHRYAAAFIKIILDNQTSERRREYGTERPQGMDQLAGR